MLSHHNAKVDNSSLSHHNTKVENSKTSIKLNVTYLSSVAASIYLPLGENLTKDTGGLSSSISVFKH